MSKKTRTEKPAKKNPVVVENPRDKRKRKITALETAMQMMQSAGLFDLNTFLRIHADLWRALTVASADRKVRSDKSYKAMKNLMDALHQVTKTTKVKGKKGVRSPSALNDFQQLLAQRRDHLTNKNIAQSQSVSTPPSTP